MSKITDAYTLLMERKFAKLPSLPVVRRTTAKAGKADCRRLRNKSSCSMMTAPHPKGMKSIPLYPDDRTAMLMSAYIGRVKDRQDRK